MYQKTVTNGCDIDLHIRNIQIWVSSLPWPHQDGLRLEFNDKNTVIVCSSDSQTDKYCWCLTFIWLRLWSYVYLLGSKSHQNQQDLSLSKQLVFLENLVQRTGRSSMVGHVLYIQRVPSTLVYLKLMALQLLGLVRWGLFPYEPESYSQLEFGLHETGGFDSGRKLPFLIKEFLLGF